MRIIFLRHGRDDDSRRGGWSSFGLVSEGKEQARAAADYFRRAATCRIGYILSSDLPRALETAQPIAAALDLPIHTDERLRETDNGDLAGMPNDEALAKYPGLFFSSLAMEKSYPNGESPAGFYRRVDAWFQALLQSPPISDGDLLVVTHGGVINVIYHLVQRLEWSNKLPSFPAANCAIHILNTDTMTFEVKNKIARM